MTDLRLLPYLTADEMREVDRVMVQELGIDLIQMMESAGRHLANLARKRFLGGSAAGKRVVVLAGSGGNGGGALVAARLLHVWGADVTVFLSRGSAEIAGVPRHQLAILERLGFAVGDAAAAGRGFQAEVILDGILGYGLSAEPRGGAAALIRHANADGAPVLALDVPSGLESSTGRVSDPTIRAAATLTLALPKRGLRESSADAFIGELYLADIGVPASVYARLGFEIGPIFATEDVVRLR